MSESILIGSGCVRFEFGDGSGVTLDLTLAMKAIGRIIKAREGDQEWKWLDDWKAWIKEQTGEELSDGKADALWEHVNVQYDLQKKTVRERLRSPSSTDSTPSG